MTRSSRLVRSPATDDGMAIVLHRDYHATGCRALEDKPLSPMECDCGLLTRLVGVESEMRERASRVPHPA